MNGKFVSKVLLLNLGYWIEWIFFIKGVLISVLRDMLVFCLLYMIFWIFLLVDLKILKVVGWIEMGYFYDLNFGMVFILFKYKLCVDVMRCC